LPPAPTSIAFESLSAGPTSEDRAALTALLVSCVAGGASIGFLMPITDSEAEAYWTKIFRDLETGNRIVLVARDTTSGQPRGRIVGAGQLALESRANGRHRAEVQKLMVLPSHRRRGIAARLMGEIEAVAKARRVQLLFLDTSDGHGGAREFYDSIGYTYVGGIPNYALDPDGTPAKNAIYYRLLGGAGAP
jgi:acetyltransferase